LLWRRRCRLSPGGFQMRIPTSISAAVVAVATATLALTSAAGASAAPPKCADLTGVLVGQTCQIRATDPAYTLSIDYPTDYPDETAVTDYIKQTRDGFLNVAKMPGFRFMPYEMDTTVTGYGSGLPPRGTQSVVFKSYQSV